MSYIEIVKWENEYRSEEQITMARTEIFSSYDVLHQNSKTLKQRLDDLRAVVARADLYAAQASWTQTGRLWVRTIQALSTELAPDVKELADCPDPVFLGKIDRHESATRRMERRYPYGWSSILQLAQRCERERPPMRLQP